VPHTSRPPSPIHNPQPNGHGVSIVLEHSREDDHEEDPLASPQLTAHQLSQPKVRSNSIAIIPNPNLPSSHFHSPKHRLSKSRSRLAISLLWRNHDHLAHHTHSLPHAPPPRSLTFTNPHAPPQSPGPPPPLRHRAQAQAPAPAPAHGEGRLPQVQ